MKPNKLSIKKNCKVKKRNEEIIVQQYNKQYEKIDKQIKISE